MDIYVSVNARHDMHISDVVICDLGIHDCDIIIIVDRLRLPNCNVLSTRADVKRWAIIVFVISLENYKEVSYT